jgi:hypothetical protein
LFPGVSTSQGERGYTAHVFVFVAALGLALVADVSVARVDDDEPGFGGAHEAPAPVLYGPGGAAGDGAAGDGAAGDGARDDREVGVASDVAPTSRPGAALSRLPTWSPPAGEAPPQSAPTKLEAELRKAGIDPQRHPLVRLRVEAERLSAALDEAERKGLSAAREVEARWLESRALLADVERVALHRMHRCAARSGRPSMVKAFRMTAGGAVAYSGDELVAQASVLDPPGCARIGLIDDGLIDKVRRARFLKATLPSTTFPFHELDRRRALEDELGRLKKELAADGEPALLVAGERGYSR